MSMKRYPHWLPYARSDAWPRRVLLVAVSSHVHVIESASVAREETLDRWGVVRLRLHDGEYESQLPEYGTSAESLHCLLRDASRDGISQLVVSSECIRVWTLLDVWSHIESERIDLIGELRRRYHSADELLESMHSVEDGPTKRWHINDARHRLEHSGGSLVVSDPPNILKYRHMPRGGWITWIDTANYGLRVPEDAIECSSQLLELSAIWNTIHRAAVELRLGKHGLTAGSQALTGYRRTYYDGRIYCDANPKGLESVSRGYYGGRCECYQLGPVPSRTFYVDIKSAYASVCRGISVPGRLQRAVEYPGGTAATDGTDYHRCIASVRIATPDPIYPYRRRNGRESLGGDSPGSRGAQSAPSDTDIIYPVGRFYTTLPGPELSYAVAHGHVDRIYSLVEYTCEPLLQRWAERLMEYRELADVDDDMYMSSYVKSLLVGLVGKFGQRLKVWEYAPGLQPLCPYGEWVGSDERGLPIRYRSIAWHTQREVVGDWSYHAMPAIACWVTSQCRLWLWQLMQLAGLQHVYYCDTDGLIVDEQGYRAIMGIDDESDHGLYRLSQRWSTDHCEIRGYRYYVRDGIVTCAGYPHSAGQDAGDGQHYWHTASITECARGQAQPSTVSELRSYSRSDAYRGGAVGADGRVYPTVLAEW